MSIYFLLVSAPAPCENINLCPPEMGLAVDRNGLATAQPSAVLGASKAQVVIDIRCASGRLLPRGAKIWFLVFVEACFGSVIGKAASFPSHRNPADTLPGRQRAVGRGPGCCVLLASLGPYRQRGQDANKDGSKESF